MSKIAVVTDTNSGITREEAKKLGVYLLPMPFIVDGTEYFEGVTCTYEHFFEMLEAGAEVSTSQPSPESLTAMWEEALATHDSVVHIPMSSALSGSLQTLQRHSPRNTTAAYALWTTSAFPSRSANPFWTR